MIPVTTITPKPIMNGYMLIKTLSKHTKRKNIPWRMDRRYRVWIHQVKRRDKKCRICGSTYRLAAHHVKDGSNHPASRYDLKNGVTLCGDCHMNFHCNFKNSYREKCDEKDWNNFVVLMEYARGLFRIRSTVTMQMPHFPVDVNSSGGVVC